MIDRLATALSLLGGSVYCKEYYNIAVRYEGVCIELSLGKDNILLAELTGDEIFTGGKHLLKALNFLGYAYQTDCMVQFEIINNN